MKKLLIAAAAMLLFSLHACKKDKQTDFREKYKGVFNIKHVHYSSYFTRDIDSSVSITDTTYTSIITVDYKLKDYDTIYYPSKRSMPYVLLIDNFRNDTLLAFIGNEGNLIIYGVEPEARNYGGFIGTDSINYTYTYDYDGGRYSEHGKEILTGSRIH